MGALTDLAFYQDMARRLGHSVSEGAKEWIPDIAGFAGDIPDAAYYLAQRLKSPATPRTLGAGPAVRRAVRSAMGIQPAAQTETGLSEIPDTDVAKILTQMLNPAMAPKQAMAAAASPAGRAMLGSLAAAHGLPMDVGALGVVKGKGSGNWIANSVEDALRGLKQQNPLTSRVAESVGLSEEQFLALPKEQRAAAARAVAGPEFSLNSWIEGPLTKYVKTRMASPEDEVRKLAEQGVLHIPNPGPQPTAAWIKDRVPTGESDMARNWDALVDQIPKQATYMEHRRLPELGEKFPPSNEYLLRQIGGQFAVDNPNELAYAFNRGKAARDLGFPHLIDELKNALNPESGLPRNLLLTPEAVQNMSMEKAVRRVHDINEWRAAQKIEANRALAEKASVVREYAPSEAMPNPKGLRWVELKADDLPDEEVAKAWDMKPEELTDDIRKSRKRELLQDQLKYEGDTMGHCVGGYCDDVFSGQTRIFSLRDAKGEPHVTVEVAPQRGDPISDAFRELDPQVQIELRNAAMSRDKRGIDWGRQGDFLPGDEADLRRNIIREVTLERFPEWRELKTPSAIKQIKGKQNRAPNEEYLPFVQDFVRNPPTGGQWSDVGDLQNTGMVRRSNVFTPTEKQGLLDLGQDVSEYLTPEDIRALRKARGDEGFASGGRVTTPNDLHNLIAELESA